MAQPSDLDLVDDEEPFEIDYQAAHLFKHPHLGIDDLEIGAGVRGVNADLADRLDTDQYQVSCAGRRLRELGLAERTRAGRLNGWSLTNLGGREVARLRRGP